VASLDDIIFSTFGVKAPVQPEKVPEADNMVGYAEVIPEPEPTPEPPVVQAPEEAVEEVIEDPVDPYEDIKDTEVEAPKQELVETKPTEPKPEPKKSEALKQTTFF
jgi:hypothetical protein